MKKALVLGVLVGAVSLQVSAQGLYFDIGLGVAKAWTKINGIDLVKALEDEGENVDEVAVDLGLKAGYGPLAALPLYIVVEFGGTGHRLSDGAAGSSDYIQFNSYMIGPGVLFYPLPFIQLGASAGYSWVANIAEIKGFEAYGYKSKNGFAWNVSAALDIGKRNHGVLIGARYFQAANTLKVTNAEQKTSMVSIFVKYAYRKKR